MAACESVPSPACSADRPSKPPCHLRAIYLPIYGVLCILVVTTTIGVAAAQRCIYAGSADLGQTLHGRFESCRGHPHFCSSFLKERGRSFLKERGRSRPRLVVFSLVCELPDPGWRVEIGVGGQGLGGARPRKRPQGLDRDAVRRTLFRTGRIERLVLLSACGTGGRCRLQGRFPGVGQARGCWSFLRRAVAA